MRIGAGLEVIVVTTWCARLVLTRWTGFMFPRRACLKVSWGALTLWTRSAVVKLSRGALSLGTVAVSWRAFT